MAGELLLAARDLAVERGGRQLFRDLNLTLAAGDLLHLRGANGAGKTTLLRILSGLSTVGFDGAVTERSACLFIGHHSAVKGLLTPLENLRWHPSGEFYGSDHEIVKALEAVGLRGYEDVPAAQLSAGQQRRVNLARLYLSHRPLWILDEPFTAIDVHGVARLQSQLVIHAGQGGGVLFTSHQSLDADVSIRVHDLMPVLS